MRLSLTTTGLLDPRQLAAWSTERRRAIHTAVAKGMQSGGREVRDAARSEIRSAFIRFFKQHTGQTPLRYLNSRGESPQPDSPPPPGYPAPAV